MKQLSTRVSLHMILLSIVVSNLGLIVILPASLSSSLPDRHCVHDRIDNDEGLVTKGISSIPTKAEAALIAFDHSAFVNG